MGVSRISELGAGIGKAPDEAQAELGTVGLGLALVNFSAGYIRVTEYFDEPPNSRSSPNLNSHSKNASPTHQRIHSSSHPFPFPRAVGQGVAPAQGVQDPRRRVRGVLDVRAGSGRGGHAGPREDSGQASGLHGGEGRGVLSPRGLPHHRGGRERGPPLPTQVLRPGRARRSHRSPSPLRAEALRLQQRLQRSCSGGRQARQAAPQASAARHEGGPARKGTQQEKRGHRGHPHSPGEATPQKVFRGGLPPSRSQGEEGQARSAQGQEGEEGPELRMGAPRAASGYPDGARSSASGTHARRGRPCAEGPSAPQRARSTRNSSRATGQAEDSRLRSRLGHGEELRTFPRRTLHALPGLFSSIAGACSEPAEAERHGRGRIGRRRLDQLGRRGGGGGSAGAGISGGGHGDQSSRRSSGDRTRRPDHGRCLRSLRDCGRHTSPRLRPSPTYQRGYQELELQGRQGQGGFEGAGRAGRGRKGRGHGGPNFYC
ncbi:hypothetical protein DFP72DRAFT_930330 [Ephemerocybe angulata]|uniref:Uncharacterized protein n=1 Tax=Ephemerocybe angulata TaxID=980116 RepID=A0A8H6HDA9_9AGAR|nr:hypothetical protein DFP72DRAFT_930330 [Tulosesus angulatus]